MTPYWPWWAGALALGAIATAHAIFAESLLGVSGKVAMLAHPVNAFRTERAENAAASDAEAFQRALLEATREEFGPGAINEESSAGASPSSLPASRATNLTASVLFLIMVIVGGFLASLMRHDFALRSTIPLPHRLLFGNGPVALVALAVGGMLVGFGTRMAGGCTSGHGLSGCARLAPAGLVATASFVGTGIITALLIRAVLP